MKSERIYIDSCKTLTELDAIVHQVAYRRISHEYGYIYPVDGGNISVAEYGKGLLSDEPDLPLSGYNFGIDIQGSKRGELAEIIFRLFKEHNVGSLLWVKDISGALYEVQRYDP